jgi:hypothetical protein
MKTNDTYLTTERVITTMTVREACTVRAILNAVKDVMNFDHDSDDWRADYESFCLGLDHDEMQSLCSAIGKF